MSGKANIKKHILIIYRTIPYIYEKVLRKLRIFFPFSFRKQLKIDKL